MPLADLTKRSLLHVRKRKQSPTALIFYSLNSFLVIIMVPQKSRFLPDLSLLMDYQAASELLILSNNALRLYRSNGLCSK